MKSTPEPIPQRSIRQPIAVALVLAAASIAACWNQSLIHWRENVLDSYLFGYYGWRVAESARPYLEVWDNKPPGIWWANALAFGIAGEGPATDWLVGGGALLLSLLAFVGIAHALWHASVVLPALIVAVLLLTHISFECGANRTETLVVLCELAGAYFYSRALRTIGSVEWRTAINKGRHMLSPPTFGLIVAGVLLGFSPWCKQSGVGALAAVCIHCAFFSGVGLRNRVAAISPLLIGVGLAQLGAVGMLLRGGALSAALFAMFRFNRLYFEIGDASWTNLHGAFWAYRDSLPPLETIGFFAAGASLLAGGRLLFKRKAITLAHPHGMLVFFWIWLAINTYLALVSVGRLSYHLMPLLPPLGLILVALIARFGGDGGLAQGIQRRPSLAAFIVLLLAAVGRCADFGFRDAAQCAARRPTEAGWWPMTPPQYARQAAEIQRCCAADEAIYVWGWSPGTYRFAYRSNSCRYGTLEKVGQLGERARFIQDEVCRILQERPPAVIAISPGDLAGMRGTVARDDFARWVIESYEDRGEIEGMHILRRLR